MWQQGVVILVCSWVLSAFNLCVFSALWKASLWWLWLLLPPWFVFLFLLFPFLKSFFFSSLFIKLIYSLSFGSLMSCLRFSCLHSLSMSAFLPLWLPVTPNVIHPPSIVSSSSWVYILPQLLVFFEMCIHISIYLVVLVLYDISCTPAFWSPHVPFVPIFCL